MGVTDIESNACGVGWFQDRFAVRKEDVQPWTFSVVFWVRVAVWRKNFLVRGRMEVEMIREEADSPIRGCRDERIKFCNNGNTMFYGARGREGRRTSQATGAKGN